LSGYDVENDLLRDCDLDLDEYRRRTDLSAANGRERPNLVNKLMLSMPAGTPPDKVLAAARVFGREHFALKHRYVVALHTDEPHLHVHMVIKAVSERAVRGQNKTPKHDGIYRAMLRGESKHMRSRAQAVAAELGVTIGRPSPERPRCSPHERM
jgi:Relaxase/Mobilisation nuclease domain